MFGRKSQLSEPSFSTDIDEPIVEKVDPMPPLSCGLLSRDNGLSGVSAHADEILKEQLQRINGVGALRMYGLRLRQARV